MHRNTTTSKDESGIVLIPTAAAAEAGEMIKNKRKIAMPFLVVVLVLANIYAHVDGLRRLSWISDLTLIKDDEAKVIGSILGKNHHHEPPEYVSPYKKYIAAVSEDYIMEHTKQLGYNSTNPRGSGCAIWKNKEINPYFDQMQAYLNEMQNYSALLKSFPVVEKDIRTLLKENPENASQVCQGLELHPEGILGLFPSKQISYTRSGYVEPLLPPLRNPRFCFQGRNILNMDYMIHDFAEMCRRLRPGGRTVFVDMGAALDFHGAIDSPAMYVTKLYSKFGFKFDHIYAFEMAPKDPKMVYERLPEELYPSYHWINVGVSHNTTSKYNPFISILKHYNKDDFVVVKLDIDTSWIEVPLAYQLLEDANLLEIVDHFYFEHHVHLAELAGSWGGSMRGTVEESLQLFRALREKGVAAHSWV